MKTRTDNLARMQAPWVAGGTLEWEIADKDISIHLHRRVVFRLNREIEAEDIRREACGLLIGRVLPGATRHILIDGVESVRNEYLDGPFYMESETNHRLWDAVLRQRHPADGEVVGFYRTQPSGELSLGPEDLNFLARYFADPSNVVLLIKPLPRETPVAGFFFWEDGTIQSQSSYKEFPFSPTGLDLRMLAPPDMMTPVHRPQVPPRHSYPPMDDLGEWQAPKESASWGTALWRYRLALALVVGALLFGFLYIRSPYPTALDRQPQASAVASPIGLKVERDGNDLLMSWNRSANGITTAQRGVLSITDGYDRKSMDLDTRQLQTGRVLYSPVSRDVFFEFEVFLPDGRSLSESIRVLGSGPLQFDPGLSLRPLPEPDSLPSSLTEPPVTARRLARSTPLPLR
ncbi:MAG: hypothetical protein ACRD7E_07165, partial [Bryobacteraceae bacterium]